MTALIVVFIAIIVLVAVANRIGVAYPIVLVLGGMAIGFIPHMPTVPLPPQLVLVVFLPPLLYWESVTAPTSEFRENAFWIFQLAFGLVIVTTIAVAALAHAIVPGMSWGVAFVLGAIVSSTDEVAFTAIADRLNVPRHLIGTIEGESLVNDATSLILYGVGIAAVVGASFSLLHAAESLALSIVEALAMGLAAGSIAVMAWRAIKDDTVQATISVVIPFIAYLPAYYIGASGVLATVTAGIFVSRFTPTVIQPQAREMLTGFWVTVVFLLNAFIFVQVGISFHQIVLRLHDYSVAQLISGGCGGRGLHRRAADFGNLRAKKKRGFCPPPTSRSTSKERPIGRTSPSWRGRECVAESRWRRLSQFPSRLPPVHSHFATW